MQVDQLKGKCELSLNNCNFNIKYSEKIEHDVKIDGEASSIEINILKNQEGNFYFESNNYINLESKKVFKEEDIKVVEDNKVIEKKIGKGPEIKVSVKGGNFRIK